MSMCDWLINMYTNGHAKGFFSASECTSVCHI